MSPARPKPQPGKPVYLGETIVAEMRAARLPLEPRHFEFWFTYKNGRNPALNTAADAIKAANGALTADDIEFLYEAHLSPWRLGGNPDAIACRLLDHTQEVDVSLEGAIGSAQTLRRTLTSELSGLDSANAASLDAILAAIDRLTRSVRESQVRYGLLEARMNATTREVDVLKQQLAAVRTECVMDQTTALPNRAAFDHHLDMAIAEAADKRHPLSVILCDLDYFAAINENFGTYVGDQILGSIAMLFKAHVRPQDFVARFDGDEFAAILPQTRASDAKAVAGKFREAVMAHELVKHPNGAGRMTVSTGVADAIKGDTSDFLLRRVGNGLAVAKREGRNRVVEMTQEGPVWEAKRRA